MVPDLVAEVGGGVEAELHVDCGKHMDGARSCTGSAAKLASGRQ